MLSCNGVVTRGRQRGRLSLRNVTVADQPPESTEQEIAGVADSGAARGPSSRKGTWYVEHPENRVRPGAKRSADVRREGSFCSCGMQLSLTGVCVNCD